MDYKKLKGLQDRLASVKLPALPRKGAYAPTHTTSNGETQKELAAVATAAATLLANSKLVRGALHQKRLVELTEKLKPQNAWGTGLPTATLRAARTTLVTTLRAVDTESRKVFIVHGRDTVMRQDVQATLHRFGIDGLVLSEEVNRGDTIIEKFDRIARDCGYAVVLCSPDDVGGLNVAPPAKRKLAARARQNVILELGYFVGLLGRRKVFVLVAADLELPSDFHGVVYEPYDSQAGRWKRSLANELEEAGFYIDPTVRKKL